MYTATYPNIVLLYTIIIYLKATPAKITVSWCQYYKGFCKFKLEI